MFCLRTGNSIILSGTQFSPRIALRSERCGPERISDIACTNGQKFRQNLRRDHRAVQTSRGKIQSTMLGQ